MSDAKDLVPKSAINASLESDTPCVVLMTTIWKPLWWKRRIKGRFVPGALPGVLNSSTVNDVGNLWNSEIVQQQDCGLRYISWMNGKWMV